MAYNETPTKGKTMSDYSLMNPDHLKKEIHVMKELIREDEAKVCDLEKDYDRIIDMVRESHDSGQDTVLTPKQTRDLIETLTKFNHHIHTTSSQRKFYVRVYESLQKDRRWFIAAKYLKFLQK